MATLTERLQLVVDATTAGAETRFQRLTGAAKETGDAAERTASSVASAADRAAQAQLRQKDAAGALNVAQARLVELQESGRAKASQVAAAQEKVAGAERRLELATHAARKATEEQNTALGNAGRQAETGARGINVMATAQRALVAGGALLAGGELLDWARELPGKFAEGARNAGQLATMMNASTEEAGSFLGLVQSIGLEMNDLVEIQAEFAQKVQATGTGLTPLGNELQHNADGTVNWVRSLTDTISQLQGVQDATERNRLGFAMFGEEGYKQLSRLVASGQSVEDALAAIGVPFTDADIAAAQEYDQAMRDFRLTAADLERTLGRALLPVLTQGVDVFEDFAGIITAIPAPLALATAGALALGRDAFGIVSRSGELATGTLDRMRTSLDLYHASVAISGSRTTAVAGAMQAGWGMARTAVGGLAGALGGPLGIALIGAGAATAAASRGTDDLSKHAHDAAVELAKLEGSADAVAIATRNQAGDLEENAGYWERSAAYVKGYQEDLSGFELAMAKIVSPFQRLTMGFGDTADTAEGFRLAIEDAKEELGAFGAQQAVSQVATKSLSDLIAEGTTSGQQFADAVAAAAGAQADQAATSGTAQAAIDAYTASTTGATQATLDLINARYATEDANFAFLQAMDTANAATDDSKTSVDEVRQAHVGLMEAALSAASAVADAAVENAEATGQVVTDLDEANIRADAMLGDLRAKLNTPGLSEGARTELQGLIDQLQTARDKGDVQAVLTLTGADEATSELDTATADRDTTVSVESRGGPAVQSYLDGLADDRLALVRVESRNGPAVKTYLGGLADEQRLALIRVESRNGPAVDTYLNGLTNERLAIIRVETRGGPAVDAYLDNLASNYGAGRTATINVARNGAAAAPVPRGAGAPTSGLYGAPAGSSVTVQNLTVQVASTGGGQLTSASLAEAGRTYVRAIQAHEQRNGAGWRRTTK